MEDQRSQVDIAIDNSIKLSRRHRNKERPELLYPPAYCKYCDNHITEFDFFLRRKYINNEIYCKQCNWN